jgi:phage terminase small subunit
MTASNEPAPARPKRHRRPKYSTRPLATVPPPEEWGPALAALTDKQRKFVLELHAGPNGYGTGVRAVKAAGYGIETSDEAVFRVMAAQALSDPKIQAALRELGPKAISAEGFQSIANIAAIANDAKVKPETRLKANIALLSHAFPAETSHVVKVEKSEPILIITEAVIERIRLLASRAGLDPQKQIELVATEVKDDEQPPT